MRRISTFFAIIALAVLPLTLMGAATSPQIQVPKGAAIIYNPGNGDYTGFLILVDHNGRAWAADGAGRGFGQLQPALTQMLFTDLAAAGPARLPVRVCASTQPDLAGTSIWVNAPNAASAGRAPSLECGSDAHSEKVVADTSLIQHALYVHAYRIRRAPELYAGTASSYAGNGSGGSYARQGSSAAPTFGYGFYGDSGLAGGFNGGGYGSFNNTSFGNGLNASGNFNSTSFGSGLNASGNFNSTSFGSGLNASGNFNNTSFGSGLNASGNFNSTSFGSGLNASGNFNSTSFGNGLNNASSGLSIGSGLSGRAQ